LNDIDRLQEFIIKATGKTIGRNSKNSLAMLFANTYAEYAKSINDVNNGYTIYKELEAKIEKIKEEMKDLDNIPTSVLSEILDNNE
jgi:hypothetical protein|tara:strand:+ start:743 stop:1000 length:258 start_codon:yes stop_codon:yes gene_type:complete